MYILRFTLAASEQPTLLQNRVGNQERSVERILMDASLQIDCRNVCDLVQVKGWQTEAGGGSRSGLLSAGKVGVCDAAILELLEKIVPIEFQLCVRRNYPGTARGRSLRLAS